jgi:hypothetical protein
MEMSQLVEDSALTVVPQCGDAPCSCGGKGAAAAQSFVYALGRIEPRFPRVSVERELAQAIGRDQTSGLTDREALHRALSNPANRYLVRQLCWVLTIEGLETYLLQPRNPQDYDLLVEALRPTPRLTDVDVVIGLRGPVASPEVCNGLMVPVVAFDQIYSFSVDQLLDAIPRPEGVEEDRYRASLEEVFSRVRLIADNAGAADDHRALNYLAVRYPAIYSKTAEFHERSSSLTGLEVRPSTLGTTRRILDVIFTYTHRTTDVAEKLFTRVDVTDEFPFLTTKLSPYFDR